MYGCLHYGYLIKRYISEYIQEQLQSGYRSFSLTMGKSTIPYHELTLKNTVSKAKNTVNKTKQMLVKVSETTLLDPVCTALELVTSSNLLCRQVVFPFPHTCNLDDTLQS